jgi:acetolactate synthase-1/2/3 large subunit
MRLSDYVMQRLAAVNVKHFFTVTGRGILFLTDALAKTPDIQAVCVHHEQAAAFGAMAYAQYSGSIGAALVSTGCGACNAVTGVLCAWQDDIPVVFISGNNPLPQTTRRAGKLVRTYGSQEADIISVVSSITKYAVMLENANDIAYELDKALHLAVSGRKGPVWLDIPLDIQNARIEPEQLKRYVPDGDLSLCADAVKTAAHALNSANRPVLLLGGGVRMAGAVDVVREFADKLRCPVVSDTAAADAFNGELYMGICGSIGATRAANFAVANCDLLLSVGCGLTSVVIGEDRAKFARAAKIIAVDTDRAALGQSVADKWFETDIRQFGEGLLRFGVKPVDSAWREKCLHWKSVFPKCEKIYKLSEQSSEKSDLHYIAEVLSKTLAPDTALICDAGFEQLIIPACVDFSDERRCIQPASQGTMGYALPAVTGVHLAGAPQTVAIIGDGSIMMNLQELQTIACNNIPAKIIVINNSGYAVIEKRQHDLFRARTIGTGADNGVSFPDFRKIADCFGLQYFRSETAADLLDTLKKSFSAENAVLIEVMATEDQKYLHSSVAVNSAKRVVHRPLEDQAPYLARDLFLAEMLIEPIDQ